MFPLIETAAAFAALMLVASLFVSAVVQAIQSALRVRARVLGDMLGALIHNYAAAHDIPLQEAEKRGFVSAVLAHPLLHSPATIKAVGGDAARLELAIEYLHEEDLVNLVRVELARKAGCPEALRAAVADVDQFERYVERWYETIGGTASEYFKQRMRRLTLGVSCAVVVLFNVDGLHLIGDLYRGGAQRGALTHDLAAIHDTSARLGSPDGIEVDPGDLAAARRRDATLRELALEMQKTSSMLDEAGTGLGWQSSWITRRWCAYKGRCAPAEARPSGARMALDALLWLAGLVFSCVMLSLGAPFWATTLGNLVNVGNAVERIKTRPKDKPAEEK
jgi:hypothetical protein